MRHIEYNVTTKERIERDLSPQEEAVILAQAAIDEADFAAQRFQQKQKTDERLLESIVNLAPDKLKILKTFLQG